jgi:hypothetical protein
VHESAPLFREEQRFSQPWLWVIVVVAAVAAWIGLAAVVLDSDDGAGWPVAIVLLLVAVGLPLLFGLARLTVEVLADRIQIRYRPFIARTLRLDEVVAAESVTYRPLREYGGWGIKGWSRRKIAYNVRGDRGALLTFSDGRTVLIGSQRADELAAAIRDRLPSSGP